MSIHYDKFDDYHWRKVYNYLYDICVVNVKSTQIVNDFVDLAICCVSDYESGILKINLQPFASDYELFISKDSIFIRCDGNSGVTSNRNNMLRIFIQNLNKSFI